MNRSKSRVIHETARTFLPHRDRYSEAGDTLIEVLLALIVLGLASVALLIAFSTSISASATHRTLANDDTVLATATQVTIANIQSQPSLFSCTSQPPLSAWPGYGPSGITLPAPYAGHYTVLYAVSNSVQYWNPGTKLFGSTCEANQPQLITIYLQGTSYSNSFVVDYPIGSSNALTAGTAAQLVFLQQPVGGYAGSPFTTQPIVEIVTAGGSPSTVTTDLSPVILTLTTGSGVLSGCSGNEILGVVTFSGCTIGTGGSNFVITATDGSLNPAVSNPFSVTSSGYHLVFTSQPVAAASGVGFATSPVVTVENTSGITDTSWAGTITLTLSGGALSALPSQTCPFTAPTPPSTNATTITLTPLNGTVTIPSGCAFSGGYYYDASRNPPQTATQYTMTATANPTTQTDAAIPARSNTFSVSSFGAASQIAFTIQPTGVASATAATPFSGQPTVAVEDSFGNVVTSATNTIGLAINSGAQGITLSNCNSPTATNAGLYVFSGCEGSNYGTGLTLTATSPGLTQAVSTTFNITNVATQLLFTTQPVAGDSASQFAIQPVLTVEDSANRVVTAATTPIAFNAAVPSSGTMSSCTSLVPQLGVITVSNCVFAGVVGTPYTIVATSGSLTSAQSSSFTPTGPGPATQLVVTTSPVAGVSGTAFTTQPVIKVEDSAGNTVTSSTAVITLTSSGGTLAACSGLTASAGVVTVSNCTFAGVVLTPYTLTATSGPLTSLPSASFSPTYAGVPTQIILSGCSSAITTGATCMASATIEDVYGNIETHDISSVLTFSQTPENGTVTGLGSPTVAAGSASDTITGKAQGLVGITVTGDSLTSNTITLTVNAPTTTAVTSSSNPAVAGQTVTFTATVSVTSPDTGVPTGNIEFLDNNTAIGVCGGTTGVAVNGSGQATCLASWSSVGTQTITAQYLGNPGAYYLGSTSSALSQVVNKASPTLSVVAPAAGTAGTAIAANTINATLANSSGTNDVNTITFTVFGPQSAAPTTCTSGGVVAGTATPAGNGTYTTSSSYTPGGAGTYWWYVSTPLDTNNNAAASTCGSGMTNTLVGKASPSIATTLSASSIAAGQTAYDTSTFTGLVNSDGTGTVTYSYYTNNTCTSASPVAAGIKTVPTSGVVPNSTTMTFNSVGFFYWRAAYSGDSNNNGISSPCTALSNEQLTVIKASPSIATTLSTSSIAMGLTAYDTSTFTGLVNSDGTGTVTYSYFTNNTCTSASPVAAGVKTVPTSGVVPNSNTMTFPNAGMFYWQAYYNGDSNNNPVYSLCTSGTNELLTVNKASPTIATTLSASSIAITGTAHDSSTFTGLVNSDGTGTVTYSYFTNNTCTSASPVAAGTVTVPTSGVVPVSNTMTFASAGLFYWQAVYSGDSNNNGISSLCTSGTNELLTVNKASPTIATTLSASSIAMGLTAHDSSTFTGLVNSLGAGTVTYSYYTNNTCTSASPVAAGTVTVPTSGVVPISNTMTFASAGLFYWQAVYSGDSNNNGISSTCNAGTNELLTVTNTVTKTTAGTYTLTVPAYVTSFNFVMNAAGGGGGFSGAGGGAGGTVSGTITIPSSSSPTTFTVIVGGAGGAGTASTGGAGGASGTGCALGGVGGGGTSADGGGGGGSTCLNLVGAPPGTVVTVGGGGGGGGKGSGTGGSGGGGPTTNPGTDTAGSGTANGAFTGGSGGSTATTGTPLYGITNTAGKLGGSGASAGTCTAGVCGAGGAGGNGDSSDGGAGGGGGGMASGGGGSAGTGGAGGAGGGGGSAYTGGTATIIVSGLAASNNGGGAGGAAATAGTAGSVSFTGAGLTLA